MELDNVLSDTTELQPFDYLTPYNAQDAQTQQAAQLISSFLSGTGNLSNLQSVSVGSGNKVFRMNQQGFWLGGTTFANSLFSVSMTGVIKTTQGVGGNTIIIDGENARIVANDGTNNRLVIGNV